MQRTRAEGGPNFLDSLAVRNLALSGAAGKPAEVLARWRWVSGAGLFFIVGTRADPGSRCYALRGAPCAPLRLMMALRLLMLLVTVAVIYLLFLRSQTPSENLPPDLVQSASPVAASGEAHAGGPQAAHSQYKEAMDRAHAAAKMMQDQHKDADSF